jgi:perosamine synthetase
MLTCRDGDFARHARALAAHGVSSTTLQRQKVERAWLRAAEMAGHNYRLSNVLAAIGYHQMLRLNEMNSRRIALAARYDQAFARDNSIRPPAVAEGATHVYQMYTIELPQGMRDPVVHELRRDEIGATVHFDPPVHLQPFYRDRGGREGQFPVTERLCQELITLPMYPDMSAEDQDRVIAAVTTAVARRAG